MRCLNCEAEAAGAYCPACGQATRVGRLGGRDLVQPAIDFINADRGWLRTAADLFRRPAALINGYLAGRRVGVTEPFKYTAVSIAIALFALWLVEPPPLGPTDEKSVAAAREFNEFLYRYGNALLLSTVPLMALGSRLFFPAARLTFVEHLVLNAYVFAQQNLVSLPFVVVGAWWPAWYGWSISVYYALCVAYFAWVLRGTVARSWWSALGGGFCVILLSYLAFFVGAVAVMVVRRLAGGG
jgi:hypothetical protein